MPARSPTFITPSHSAITPVSPREISNAVLLLSNSDLTRAANTPASPKKTSLNSAIRKATRKKPTHSALSINLETAVGRARWGVRACDCREARRPQAHACNDERQMQAHGLTNQRARSGITFPMNAFKG